MEHSVALNGIIFFQFNYNDTVFTEEMREVMMKAGLIEKQNLIDRRLQVNRGRQLKMYRVWIQCKYTKPLVAGGRDTGTGTVTSSQDTQTVTNQDLPNS